MKVSVRMEDTYLCTVLDWATYSMEMINTLLEKEGEGKRERKRMVWGTEGGEGVGEE